MSEPTRTPRIALPLAIFVLLVGLLELTLSPAHHLQHIGPGQDAHIIALARDAQGTLYAGDRRGTVFRQTGGTFWHPIPPPAGVSELSALVAHPALTVATSQGAWRFTEAGGWRRIEAELPTGYRPTALFASHDRGLYMAMDAGIWHSDNGRDGWQPLPGNGLPEGARIHRLIALRNGLMASLLGHGVYRLSDEGWEAETQGLPADILVYELLTLPDETVLAATDRGLYRMEQGALRWQPWPAGLEERRISAVAMGMQGDGYRLWAASGADLYRIDSQQGAASQPHATAGQMITALSLSGSELTLAAGQVYRYQSWPSRRIWHLLLAAIVALLVWRWLRKRSAA